MTLYFFNNINIKKIFYNINREIVKSYKLHPKQDDVTSVYALGVLVLFDSK